MDCERDFSAQNQVKTALRNIISAERVDDLLVVKIEGEDLKKRLSGSTSAYF